VQQLPSAQKVPLFLKCGDDLRQDQLIMQLMLLMDGLLKKVNLDLRLLTYRVMAFTPNDGMY
jgi:phosphatidylinositol 3-kinase